MRSMRCFSGRAADAFLDQLGDVPADRMCCLLCSRPASLHRVWHPEEHVRRQLGEPDGVDLIVGYSVCAEHASDEFIPDIEGVIVSDVRRALDRPESN